MQQLKRIISMVLFVAILIGMLPAAHLFPYVKQKHDEVFHLYTKD